ncbi:uncharacterized protein [Branchiostoma lanceolatum]|uniref:uncharacterized protein n=1 Tax=Branchiostoma lanceolatum TaxID=7740 RepID=UPI003456B80D
MEETPPKEPAEHQGEESVTIGVKDKAKVQGDLKNKEAAATVKEEDDDDKEEDKTTVTDDLTQSFQHLEVTSGDLGLIFEKALQEAFDNQGRPQSHRLPDWPPAVEASQQHLIHGMTQQNFLDDKLKVNRYAKDRFNRRCKDAMEISGKTPEKETGNRGAKQAKHPRRVAVPEAVEVYNEILKYYLKNGKMPQ